MFRIHSFEVLHWDYWERFELPLAAQIITIAGPNGSGKTTLLDGLRTLLGLPCSGKRDFKRYLRHSGQNFAWLRAVVDNRAKTGSFIKPFHPLSSDQVTLLCRFVNKSGEWQRQYLIEPGSVVIGAALEESKNWLGPEQYRRRLAEAGLSSAVAKVLALEQGETDKLCEYSPRQLLDLVFTVFGDKEPLENYHAAKEEQKKSEAELGQQKLEVERAENQLETLRSKVARFKKYESLNQQQQDLQDRILPMLKMLDEERASKAHEQQAALLLEQHNEALGRGQALSIELQNISTQLAGLEAENSQLEASHASLLDAHNIARDSHRDIQKKLAAEQALTAEASKQSGEDMAALAASLHAATGRADELRLARSKAKERSAELTEEITSLQAHGHRVPADVETLRAELNKAGIAHSLLVEIVEIADEHWRGAVEALLKAFPHLIVLHRADDATPAFAIGERLRYRHFITPEREPLKAASAGSVLEVLRFTAPPPPWFYNLLNRVQRVENVAAGNQLPSGQEWITRDGYHRERRGARDVSVPAHQQHYGEGARLGRLAAAEAEQARLQRQLQRLGAESAEAEDVRAQFAARMAGHSAAMQLAQRAAEFLLAHEQAADAAANAATALAAFNTACEREKSVVAELAKASTKSEELTRQAQQARGDAHLFASKAAAEQEAATSLAASARIHRALLSTELLAEAALAALIEQFPNEGEAQRKARAIAEELAEGDWETDPQIVARHQKLSADFALMGNRLKTREHDLAQSKTGTDAARAAYIGVLQRSVQEYARNLKQLGKLAHIEVQHEAPHLNNDDAVLAQAGLNVRFNFDGKGLMGLNDGEASGGQQVIKSLILLMALMMDERNSSSVAGSAGFVFIDEPFAHLDVVNIDRVGEFLRATQAQYLITTPLTHNVNVYQPTDLTLLTSKKLAGARWAPPVGQVRRTGR